MKEDIIPIENYIDDNGSWFISFNENELIELFEKYNNL